jgi:hypothetical protein
LDYIHLPPPSLVLLSPPADLPHAPHKSSLSAFMSFLKYLDSTYQRKHVIFVFLSLAYFT